MRSLLVRVLATAISLFTAGYFVQGFRIDSSWQAYLIASLVFIVTSSVIGPIIKLLLLPINLLTLGLFRWLSNVLVLYIFDLLYQGVTISGYNFPGASNGFLAIPPLHLSLFWTLVLSSLVISLTYSLVSALFHSE